MNWYKRAQNILTDSWDDYENPGDLPILINYNNGTPPAPQIVTQIIKQQIKEYGMSPYEINNGSCDTFAEELMEKIPGSRIYETNIYSPHPSHLFIQVGDKFYDAESPHGVLDWKELGVYKQLQDNNNLPSKKE